MWAKPWSTLQTQSYCIHFLLIRSYSSSVFFLRFLISSLFWGNLVSAVILSAHFERLSGLPYTVLFFKATSHELDFFLKITKVTSSVKKNHTYCDKTKEVKLWQIKKKKKLWLNSKTLIVKKENKIYCGTTLKLKLRQH